MADTTMFASIGELLPPEQRERLDRIRENLDHVPEDDADLQTVEMMAFATLAIKGIPDRVADLLSEAQQALTTDQAERLGKQFGEILTNSLDTPSYKDLREMVRTMRETYERGRQESGKVINSLESMQAAMSRFSRFLPNLTTGFAGGLLALVVGSIAAFFVVPVVLEPEPITVPETLWPYVELQRQGRLDHFDDQLESIANGDDVRILLIKGDVVKAYREGEGAVVVIRRNEESN